MALRFIGPSPTATVSCVHHVPGHHRPARFLPRWVAVVDDLARGKGPTLNTAAQALVVVSPRELWRCAPQVGVARRKHESAT
jgi:hypothetical protein